MVTGFPLFILVTPTEHVTHSGPTGPTGGTRCQTAEVFIVKKKCKNRMDVFAPLDDTLAADLNCK